MTPRSLSCALLCMSLSTCAPTIAAQSRDASVPTRTFDVHGRVVDDAGHPIAGAIVTVTTSYARRTQPPTGPDGTFTVRLPSAIEARIDASHPDYGIQHTVMSAQSGRSYMGASTEPLTLTLRRGVVLRGQLVDSQGQPRANEPLFLVYDYEGSGPFPLETTTDATGHFAFPRAVLEGFTLVARTMDDWHPEMAQTPGTYGRVVADHDAWLASAARDQPVTITVESYTLVSVALALAVARTDVDVWLRRSDTDYLGRTMHTDAHGECRTLMETGVRYELWVSGHHDAFVAPWTQSIAPSWAGAVGGAQTLTLPIP